MKTKKCSGCKIEKPLDDFSNNKNYSDGKNYYCKECRNTKYNYYVRNTKAKHLNFDKKETVILLEIVTEYLNYLKTNSDIVNDIEKIYNSVNIIKIIEEFQKNNLDV